MQTFKQLFSRQKSGGENASFFKMWREAAEQYAAAAVMFSDAADPALIEAAIFDMKAAEARRSFALQQLRLSGGSVQSVGVLRTNVRRSAE